jgi:hypothetical protein
MGNARQQTQQNTAQDQNYETFILVLESRRIFGGGKVLNSQRGPVLIAKPRRGGRKLQDYSVPALPSHKIRRGDFRNGRAIAEAMRARDNRPAFDNDGNRGAIMRVTTGLIVGCLTALGIGTVVPANAQYYYPPPSGYYPPPPGYGYGYRYRTWNGCPRGWTVQGGNCAPYKGPGGGGWNTWNGCPPGYTVQGGNCAPYRGY